MEELDPVRLLGRFSIKDPEEFQPINNNKFIEITHYEVCNWYDFILSFANNIY